MNEVSALMELDLDAYEQADAEHAKECVWCDGLLAEACERWIEERARELAA